MILCLTKTKELQKIRTN